MRVVRAAGDGGVARLSGWWQWSWCWPMLPVGWYLASPLFIDRRVDEEFPVAAVATGTAILAVPAAAAIATERPTATPTVPQPTLTPAPTALPTGTAIPGVGKRAGWQR
ncbi:MAG: hypothetical protein U0232_20925 [Thermomicrobiales bacterium]